MQCSAVHIATPLWPMGAIAGKSWTCYAPNTILGSILIDFNDSDSPDQRPIALVTVDIQDTHLLTFFLCATVLSNK